MPMLSLVFAAAILAATPSPQQLLADVHRTYLRAGDIEARFEQTYVGGLRARKKVETGRLWAKQDGRVRWQYDEPEPKYFVFDGKTAYFYEPHNSQVMVFDDFKTSKLSVALELLIGRADVSQHFTVEACQAHCDLARDGSTVLELVPKEIIANVERIALVVDPATKRVTRSVLFDSLGYRTEYAFTEVTFNASIPDSKFRFQTPPGVQELRAAQLEGRTGR